MNTAHELEDGAGATDASSHYAAAARRVLRAQRRRPPEKKSPALAVFGALAVVALVLGVGALSMLQKPAAVAPSERVPQPVRTSSPPTAAESRAALPGAADATQAASPMLAQPPASEVTELELRPGEVVRVRALPPEEARALSGGRWRRGLRVVNAVAGNALGLRSGDLVYDGCGEAGATLEAMLASGGGPCMVILSDGVFTPFQARSGAMAEPGD